MVVNMDIDSIKSFNAYNTSENPVIFRGTINLPFVAYIMMDYKIRYGNQFVAVINGGDSGFGLPILKSLKNLEVGKFYKITRLAEVKKGKYTTKPYDVVEITEAEYDGLAPIYKQMEYDLYYDEDFLNGGY